MTLNPHVRARENSSRHERDGNAWSRPGTGGDRRPSTMPISLVSELLIRMKSVHSFSSPRALALEEGTTVCFSNAAAVGPLLQSCGM